MQVQAQRQSVELERHSSQEVTYSCEEFIQQIRNLSEISIVFFCPFGQTELANIYDQTLERFNMKVMDQKILRQFASNLMEKNKKDIQQQVNYYLGQIRKKLLSNLETLSRRQFWKVIAGCKQVDKRGLISDMLTQKSRNAEFVSCKKMISLLEDIQNQIEKGLSSALSPQNLENQRISEREVEIHGNMDEIISTFQIEQKLQLEKYFLKWHKKMEFFYEFIADQEIRYQVQNFLDDMRQQENDLLYELRGIEARNEELTNTCWEYEEVNQKLQDQMDLYSQVANQRKIQLTELQHELKKLQRQNSRINDDNDILNEAINEGRTNLMQLSSQLAMVEQQLNDYKQRYNDIYEEYSKLAKEQQDQDIIAKKQEHNKIFTERTMKQQLDDALHKFNRLLRDTGVEKKKWAAEKQEHIMKIQLLQTKIAELQDEARLRNSKMEDYIRSSKIFNFRNSQINKSRISRMSIRSGIGGVGSGIFDVPQSTLVTSMIKKKSSKREIPFSQVISEQKQPEVEPQPRISIKLSMISDKKITNKSVIDKIDISADAENKLEEIEQEEDCSQMVDAVSLPPQQNLTNIIRTDSLLLDASEKSNSGSKKERKHSAQMSKNDISQKILDQVKSTYFLSKAVLINPYGVKTETTFLLTKKRFCFFDTKLRLSRFVPVENIKAFVFCRTNPTIFVLRPKNVHQLSSRQHFTNPLIVSTRSRAQFASYLVHKFKNIIKENQIILQTKYEDDIFLKIDNNEINMKHKIPNMKNPFRLALSHAQVFYVRLQEQGLLNFKYNAIVVVQPIGLICLEGTQVNQLEAAREFLFFLPLEDSKINQKQESKEAPGRKIRLSYNTDTVQSYYSLIFNSKEDLKTFMRSCSDQKKANEKYRTTLYKSLEEQFRKI